MSQNPGSTPPPNALLERLAPLTLVRRPEFGPVGDVLTVAPNALPRRLRARTEVRQFEVGVGGAERGVGAWVHAVRLGTSNDRPP